MSLGSLVFHSPPLLTSESINKSFPPFLISEKLTIIKKGVPDSQPLSWFTLNGLGEDSRMFVTLGFWILYLCSVVKTPSVAAPVKVPVFPYPSMTIPINLLGARGRPTSFPLRRAPFYPLLYSSLYHATLFQSLLYDEPKGSGWVK